MSAEDRIKAAYAIAVEDSWPEEETSELNAWRQEVLSQEERQGS